LHGHYLQTEPARADVDASGQSLLLEFGAPWCGHCQAAQPAIRLLLGDQPRLEPLKLEDGRDEPPGRPFRVMLWPTLVLLRNSQQLARVVRPLSDADLLPLRKAQAAL
jgi:thioredoxin 1